MAEITDSTVIILLTFKGDVDEDEAMDLIEDVGGDVVAFDRFPVVIIKVPADDEERYIDEYESYEMILSADVSGET
ncbi:MAG TPA: hypothetical protein VJA22_00635 [Patescibacteria group bacterium]|nr:hypothetical protein [Patescibacteria group bacterium]